MHDEIAKSNFNLELQKNRNSTKKKSCLVKNNAIQEAERKAALECEEHNK